MAGSTTSRQAVFWFSYAHFVPGSGTSPCRIVYSGRRPSLCESLMITLMGGSATANQGHSRCNNPKTAIWWSNFSPHHLGIRVSGVMFRFFSLFLIRSATTFPYGQPCRETLINSSFRAKRCGNPESGCYDSISNWIPAFAGMTEKIIRVSLVE